MKKLLAFILTAAIASTALVGCAKTPETSPSSAPPSPESKTESTESKAPTGDPVTLTYWSMWSAEEAQGVAVQKVVDDYMAETGNTVKIEWKGRDINNLIQAALDAKTEIDLFENDFLNISRKYAGQSLDLEEMAKAANYDSFAIPVLPKTVRDVAGSLKCIPFQPYTSGIFYSKAAFEKAKIDKEPQTWTEFLDVCEKLKTAGYVPLAQDDAYVTYTLGFHLARYIGEEGIKDMIRKGEWAENPAVTKALDDMATLRTKGYLSKTAPDTYPEGQNELGFGTAAMVINASWVPQEISNNTQSTDELGMFNYPSVDGGKDANTIQNVGAQGIAIPSASKHPQEAFDLIMRLTSGEGDLAIANGSNGVPADTRNTVWPPLVAGCQDAFNALTGIYDWNCGLGLDADISALVDENMKKVFAGTIDTKGFIKALEAAGLPKVVA